MKKIALASVAFLLGIQSIMAQGWIGSNNSLYPVNTSLGLTPLQIGIGTNAPSAQLHTTGSVRFGGLSNNNLLNRVLVSDSLGNLSYRDASSLSASGNFWSLTGNNPTSTQFIGTLNNEPFKIRTSNTERMTILSSAIPATAGFVGLSTTAPVERLDVNGNIALRGDNIRRTNGNLNISAEGYNDSNSALTLGYTGRGNIIMRPLNYPTWGVAKFTFSRESNPLGLRISYNLNGAENMISLDTNVTRFSRPVEVTSGQISGYTTNFFRISSTNGNVANGIMLNTTFGYSNQHHGVIITNAHNGTNLPTVTPGTTTAYGNLAVSYSGFSLNNSTDASVHHLRIQRSGDVELGQKLIIGNVLDQKIRLWRESNTSQVFFPSLPQGTTTDRVLVWDATTGQVRVAPTAMASRANPEESESDLQKKIKDQNARITQLENALATLQQRFAVVDNTTKEEATLYQNVPNPTNQNTVINFSLPKEAKSAKLMLCNLQGEQLKSYSINGRGDNKIEILSGELKTGMYIYTLVVDGKIIDSKKMIITD